MVTVKADDKRRVQIPGIKAGQIFAIEDRGNGVHVLTELEAAMKEPFPEGSLTQYFTEQKNAEELAILKDCAQEPPGDE